MPQNLNVCIFPMQLAWGDKEKNMLTLRDALCHIPENTDLIVLPEMFSTGFLTENKEDIRKLAERNTGETMREISEISSRHSVAIAGSFIADTGGLLSNRAFFADPAGDIVFADKRHLFSPGGENKAFSPGDSRLNVRFRGWNIALVVCYDIRFPVWCRNRNNEYDLLLAVANWPLARIDVWEHLLRARAIENLAYVCGSNCKGTAPHNVEHNGASFVFDFRGKEISVKDKNAYGLIFASLNYEKLQAFRKRFPAWADADNFNIIQ